MDDTRDQRCLRSNAHKEGFPEPTCSAASRSCTPAFAPRFADDPRCIRRNQRNPRRELVPTLRSSYAACAVTRRNREKKLRIDLRDRHCPASAQTAPAPCGCSDTQADQARMKLAQARARAEMRRPKFPSVTALSTMHAFHEPPRAIARSAHQHPHAIKNKLNSFEFQGVTPSNGRYAASTAVTRYTVTPCFNPSSPRNSPRGEPANKSLGNLSPTPCRRLHEHVTRPRSPLSR